MDSCDVLIVGGGPAGSSCAWGLRQSGLDVLVLDKQVFPRDKVCGGWITPAVLTQLEIDPAEYETKRLLQPIMAFRVGCIDGSALETEYEEPVSYGIRRREFDDYLLNRSGARFLLGVPLTTLERDGDEWVVNGRLRARVVVGAGGHFCPVARFMGAKVGSEPAVVAQEAEFEMDERQMAACSVMPEMPELYFCSDMAGYGWCFRKGKVLNVGLGRADVHGLSNHVAGFLRFLQSSGRVMFDIPRLHGHAYLLFGTSTRPVVDDGMLLTGDAVGLAYRHSGEGIRPAVESGLLAAKTIAAVHGVYDRSTLDDYRRQIGARSEPATSKAAGWFPRQWSAFLGRQLLKRQWFVRDVVLNQWFMAGQ